MRNTSKTLCASTTGYQLYGHFINCNGGQNPLWHYKPSAMETQNVYTAIFHHRAFQIIAPSLTAMAIVYYLYKCISSRKKNSSGENSEARRKNSLGEDSTCGEASFTTNGWFLSQVRLIPPKEEIV